MRQGSAVLRKSKDGGQAHCRPARAAAARVPPDLRREPAPRVVYRCTFMIWLTTCNLILGRSMLRDRHSVRQLDY